MGNKPKVDGPINPFTLGGTSPPTKFCNICEIEKPESEFYLKGPGRLDKKCKKCCLVNKRKKYAEKSEGRNQAAINQETVNTTALTSQEDLLTPKKATLAKEIVYELAEIFLILEKWNKDLDTQQEISNSNSIQTETKQ